MASGPFQPLKGKCEAPFVFAGKIRTVGCAEDFKLKRKTFQQGAGVCAVTHTHTHTKKFPVHTQHTESID